MEPVAILQSICGARDLEEVTELEIIFQELSNSVLKEFGRLRNLRRICLIDTRMSTIANLRAVGSTLQSLTLTKQGLTKMENLAALPNLTELYLHRNQISKIEGLQFCSKLRKLWLSENRIEKLEGLENLGDLRELCVQSNRITALTGLESNSTLALLDISHNNIQKLGEVKTLRDHAHLRSLSLQSDLFGACPVVFQEGYRDYVICTLKQLRSLDGANVQDEDRSAAEDEFVHYALNFNDRVQELHNNHREALRIVEAQRLRAVQDAEQLKSQLLAQFAKLRDVVTRGRERVRNEHERQIQIRQQNMAHMKTQLTKLKRQHSQLLNALVEDEKQASIKNEAALARILRRARLDLNERILMAEVSQGTCDEYGTVTNRVSYQIVCDESSKLDPDQAELKAVANLIIEAQQASAKWLIYRATKLFNSTLFARHTEAVAATSIGMETQTVQLFVGINSLAMLREVAMHGLAALGKNEAIVLCRDPQQAARLAGPSDDLRGMSRVLWCRAELGRLHKIEAASKSTESIQELTKLIATRPGDCVGVHVNAPIDTSASDLGMGSEYFILPVHNADLALVNAYFILCSESEEHNQNPGTSFVARERALETVMRTFTAKSVSKLNLNTIPENIEAKLNSIESKIEGILQQYESRVQHEMDPSTAEQLEHSETETTELETTLTEMRTKVEREKLRQEEILRDFSPAMLS